MAAPRLGAAQGQPGRRVLRFVPQADLALLDPIHSVAFVSRNHAMMVYDTLYGWDAELRARPQMAEGHTISNDGREWRIRLREGLRFACAFMMANRCARRIALPPSAAGRRVMPLARRFGQ